MCNNAVIQNESLLGQPTEGALLALAMKVSLLECGCDNCYCNILILETNLLLIHYSCLYSLYQWFSAMVSPVLSCGFASLQFTAGFK